MELRAAYEETLQWIEPLKRGDTRRVDAFVKDETYDKYKEGRGIYSRSDYFKVIAGPMFKAVEEILYSLKTNTTSVSWDEECICHSETFVKHIPVLNRAAHILNKLKGPGRKYMITDYTAYEKHFTKKIMNMIEFKLYRFLFRNCPLQSILLNKILEVLVSKNKIYFRDFVYHMEAGRMSGEMNTSLGNGFANFMIFQFVHHQLGNTQVDGVFEGDDGAGCYVGTDPTTEMYAELGFTCKIELITEVCEASFCGLIYDEVDQVSIANPIKILLNLGWSNMRYVNCKNKKRKKLLKAKLLSLAYQYPGVPIVQPMARHFLTLFHPRLKADFAIFDRYMQTEIIEGCKNLPPPAPITPRTRHLMERIFGVSVAEQLELENYFTSMTTLPEHYSHDIIYNHCTRDQKHYFHNYCYHDSKMIFNYY